MHILIAAPLPLLRLGLRRVLEGFASNIACTEVPTLADAANAVRTGPRFQLIVVDSGLSGSTHAPLLRELGRAQPQAPLVLLAPPAEVPVLRAQGLPDVTEILPTTADIDELRHQFRRILGHPDSPVAAAPGDSEIRINRLTGREREVLGLLARGMTNRDIAEQLSLREVTIKAHLRHMFKKLGVTNRTQAAARALNILSTR